MQTNSIIFEEHEVLHELKHYLPAQAPLKDFIHHNTLHAFQKFKFSKAIYTASTMLGYRVSMSLAEYRGCYESGRIKTSVLEKILTQQKGVDQIKVWKQKMLHEVYHKPSPRIGSLRANWKREYQIDLDSLVHPLLFRILCSFLDQGIAMWNFPVWHNSFLASIREMERVSFSSFFRQGRAKKLLLGGQTNVSYLLNILIGDESLYKQYLFDQQFSHQGWSGMVSAVEDQPQTLLDARKISLHDLIVFELLLEIDALDDHFGEGWLPLCKRIKEKPVDLFAKHEPTELDEVTNLWQEAYEWSYYDEVLKGLQTTNQGEPVIKVKSFQAMFCIDDRACSLRRYLEKHDPACETFGTPGFFGVEFFFQPDHGKFYTKLCPAPITPKYLIKEIGVRRKHEKDVHFTKHSHSLFSGWLISQTLGFWSAFKLLLTIFKPSVSPAMASSFKHMEKTSKLTIENKHLHRRENDLQIGFTIEEMAVRVESLLKSIGLVKDFAPIVYVIGHGSSSVNNPHYAAYDCGACSGRAGSVNSRVICHMANQRKVRELLSDKGLEIPDTTQFVGGLHDTTRDEIMFFDEELLSIGNRERHWVNESIFTQALDANSKERSRRFESINTELSTEEIHAKIRIRSVSLFEPRPELNHATNSLCIVGRRSLTQHLFLDRRAFLNSFDYQVDPDGNYLFNILEAAASVCGGINLEYFFSRVDNQKLGAGTKLPHNVMGLFGVANGIDGDLRPGLPSQMIEVHDPVRLLLVVEHFPEVVLKTIQKSSETYEWFINEWVHLIVIHPITRELFHFKEGRVSNYKTLTESIQKVADIETFLESQTENISVHLIS